MRKNVFGRQLSRTKNQRRALFRSLISSLVERGEIETTLAKAKAIRGEAEKLVTKAKDGSLAQRRAVQKFFGKTDLVNRLCDVIAPIFKEKKGGYLRIVRIGNRVGDGAEMVKVMFTEEIPAEIQKEKVKKEPEVRVETKVAAEIKKEKPNRKSKKEVKK